MALLGFFKIKQERGVEAAFKNVMSPGYLRLGDREQIFRISRATMAEERLDSLRPFYSQAGNLHD
jgi:hypothetical protein